MSLRWFLRASMAVAARPALWATGFRQLWRLRRRGWWRTAPFLPLPSPDYLRFRAVTAYGDPDREPEPADIVTYLHWCRAWPRIAS